MAERGDTPIHRNMVSGEDMGHDLKRFCALDPVTKRVVLATDRSTAPSSGGIFGSAYAIGSGNPGQAGQHVAVAFEGIVQLICGAPVAAGSPLTVDAEGRCVTANSGDFWAGLALSSTGAANEHLTALLHCPAQLWSW